MTKQTTLRGRPAGRVLTRHLGLRVRDIDLVRLQRLAEKMDREQSWIVRRAIEEMAQREGVA
jgi:predicted transcriptional regulator